eukprot:12195510-Ditylum_brightwellii.AAC.1
MDAQEQPSLDWIKAQITGTNNSMNMLQNQALQAVQNMKEESTKKMQQAKEEAAQRDETQSNMPQTSFSSVSQQGQDSPWII